MKGNLITWPESIYAIPYDEGSDALFIKPNDALPDFESTHWIDYAELESEHIHSVHYIRADIVKELEAELSISKENLKKFMSLNEDQLKLIEYYQKKEEKQKDVAKEREDKLIKSACLIASVYGDAGSILSTDVARVYQKAKLEQLK